MAAGSPWCRTARFWGAIRRAKFRSRRWGPESERWDPLETGLIEEFYPEMDDTGQSRRVLRVVAAGQTIVNLHLNTRATGVEMKDARTIRSVLAVQCAAAGGCGWPRRCSSTAWVTAGWAFTPARRGGRARKPATNTTSPRPPWSPTPHTMGNDLYTAAFSTPIGRPVPFVAPRWAYHWSSPDDFEPPDSHRRLSAGRPPTFTRPPVATVAGPTPEIPTVRRFTSGKSN